ncbi:gamma-glutamyl-gamma-aminobutyrate hydrolase family protein [Azospirillum rugosum]|uniref:Glutamine amidotransferase n=1 Tax=Azospirillum rugosum TaxID=416170 RepID=A0ABS4SN61_9PROT|nr:gamma-glutamyl-gamma-aminobutyrate hydrolase family protein [Azospirillum rugosum]MBP2293922.1 putative glutamine amidotransferase [Azospirillum rugosum]MDQ0526891.1 putative glutamine amidotransferase [Azospirillum rugosum]
MNRKPLIGVPACARMMGEHPFHVVGDKYVRAVSDGAGGMPLLIPALGTALDMEEVAGRLDGLLVTGSKSNLEPHRYGGAPSEPGTLHDPQRDDTTLPLIRAALEMGVPLLGICRGFQELNVALGGTLHQSVHSIPGYDDHREDERTPLAVQYGPAHTVRLTPGGVLAGLAGGAAEVRVNSLHGQGIDRLANGLVVEATAQDGLVEAVRVAGAPAFALAVQWHPEWRFWENPLSAALLRAFGAAAVERAHRRIA